MPSQELAFRQEALQRRSIPRGDFAARFMFARGNKLATRAPYAVDTVVGAGKDPAVEQCIVATMFERGNIARQGEEVRTSAHGDAGAGHPESMRAAAHCPFEQHASGRTTVAATDDIARAMR